MDISAKRITDLREAKNWKQAELARRAGLDKSVMSRIESGDRSLKSEELKRLAAIFGTSTDYILGVTNSPAADEDAEFEITDDNVSVYGEIHAGEAAWAEQNIIGKVPVSKSVVMRYGKNNLFALRIKGDSMNHVLLDGYVAVFAKDTTIENNDIVAVLIDHEDATIKRFTQTSAAVIFEPDSTNPTHQPYFFPKSEPQDFEILGKYIYATTQLI